MKKIVLVLFIVGIFLTPISAEQEITNIYHEESKEQKIIRQLYEDKNVRTYKFIVKNAVEDSFLDIVFYIDGEIKRTDISVLEFQNETDYFIIVMTLETLVIRSHRTKRKKYSTKAMNKIDVGFTYALQKIRFIREDNTPIKNGDLILQFENSINNHNYRIDLKYSLEG